VITAFREQKLILCENRKIPWSISRSATDQLTYLIAIPSDYGVRAAENQDHFQKAAIQGFG
jgi:hypothetical protein